ncbi:hypothetical protein GGR51DRAFT_549431 [Nemania sp. FL0031]|nr:hypothetical protein GGR51DRAFT_549431 [Nemania sp. FL0031]
MPVTIKIANHEANLVPEQDRCNDTSTILSKIEPDYHPHKVIQSSFDNETPHPFKANANGFVQTIVDAYNRHHHVVIRPDDIWLNIMVQFSSYVGAHAEELREKFVAHEGQEELRIISDATSRFGVDYEDFVTKISDLIEEKIVDPELRAWIAPTFSTTTPKDTIISSLIMMGTLKFYFKYVVDIWCGIPSVTLLGEKSDYEDILARLDKFSQYGDEPTEFARLLRPIITRMVRSMDEPNSPELLLFWRNMCVVDHGSGSASYNGWITAFCFWSNYGSSQLCDQPRLEERMWDRVNTLCLDGILYGKIDSNLVPAAYVKVPVEINENGEKVQTEMLVGSMVINCTSSGRASAGENGSVGVDTLQPGSGWFIYEVKSRGDRHLVTP